MVLLCLPRAATWHTPRGRSTRPTCECLDSHAAPSSHPADLLAFRAGTPLSSGLEPAWAVIWGSWGDVCLLSLFCFLSTPAPSRAPRPPMRPALIPHLTDELQGQAWLQHLGPWPWCPMGEATVPCLFSPQGPASSQGGQGGPRPARTREGQGGGEEVREDRPPWLQRYPQLLPPCK